MLTYLGVILVIIALIPAFILVSGLVLGIYGILNSVLIKFLLGLSDFTYYFMRQGIESIGIFDYSIGFVLSVTVLASYIYTNFYAFSDQENKLTFSERLNASAVTSILVITAIKYSFYSVHNNSFEAMISAYRGLILLLPILTIIISVKTTTKIIIPKSL